MKLFVSMRMHGTDETKLHERLNSYVENVKTDENLKDDIQSPIEVINTIDHVGAPKNASRLWYLGESIKKLSDADMVYFADDWYKANGCWVEFVAAHLYLDNANIIYDYPDEWTGRWIMDIIREVLCFIDEMRRRNDEEEKK